MQSSILCLFTLTLALTHVQGQIDVTLIPGNSGSAVVEATVTILRNSCAFPNDYNFLRRLAFASSQDGNDPDTYRPGFDGGIWLVSRDNFLATQSSPSLVNIWPKIQAEFNIDWSRVSYSELRKPLYSGIAGMLTLIRLTNGNIPRLDEEQGAFYHNNFVPSVPNAANDYLKLVKTLKKDCSNNILDIAFMVDASSSLSANDFEQAKRFSSKVLDGFTVSPNDVRVAFVTFSSGAKSQFNFQRYTTKADVQSAILKVKKDDGVTDTHIALKYASDVLFTAVAGSRPSATQVVVIITDGASSNNLEAVRNAQALKDKGVILFVIGVGDEIDSTELFSLASNPTCTHVQELQNYAELNSLINEVRAVSCSVPGLDFGQYTFPCTRQQTYRVDTRGVTSITVRTRSGTVSVYGTYSSSSINSGNPDFGTMATATRPTVIYINDKDRPLYLTVLADQMQISDCNTEFYLQIESKNALRRDTDNTCITNGVVRTCTALDILMALYQVTKPSSLGFASPCADDRTGYYPHPFSSQRFIYCNRQGTAYLVDCPFGLVYYDTAKDCGPPTTTQSTTTPLTTPSTPTTPTPSTTFMAPMTGSTDAFLYQPFPECNSEAYQKGIRFFGYALNETKYIQCTEYPGLGVLKDCQEFHKWNQDYQACVYKDTVFDWTKNIYQITPDPFNYMCKSGEASLFYHEHPNDQTKYIQCDAFGDAFVKTCPKYEIWNQILSTCVPGIPRG